MRKSRTYGSVRGTPGNRRSYRDHRRLTSLPGQARQPSLCRHSGGSRNPGVAGAGIQLFEYGIKGLDPGVRPRIQTLRGRLGDDKKAMFSHVLPRPHLTAV